MPYWLRPAAICEGRMAVCCAMARAISESQALSQRETPGRLFKCDLFPENRVPLFAIALFAANFLLTPISVVPIVTTLVWALAAGQLLVQLWRARPIVDSDAEHRPAFQAHVVPIAQFADGQSIDSVLEKKS